MDPSRIDINPITDTKGLLGGIRVLGIGDGQLARKDEMRSQARM